MGAIVRGYQIRSVWSCGILAGEQNLKLKDGVAHISRTRMIVVKKKFAPSDVLLIFEYLLVFEYLKSPVLRVISINKSRVKLFLRVSNAYTRVHSAPASSYNLPIFYRRLKILIAADPVLLYLFNRARARK